MAVSWVRVTSCGSKRTEEAGRIVHVFIIHPFKRDVVVLVGERRELCSIDGLEKVEA
jgi:hypothetical protein